MHVCKWKRWLGSFSFSGQREFAHFLNSAFVLPLLLLFSSLLFPSPGFSPAPPSSSPVVCCPFWWCWWRGSESNIALCISELVNFSYRAELNDCVMEVSVFQPLSLQRHLFPQKLTESRNVCMWFLHFFTPPFLSTLLSAVQRAT